MYVMFCGAGSLREGGEQLHSLLHERGGRKERECVPGGDGGLGAALRQDAR